MHYVDDGINMQKVLKKSKRKRGRNNEVFQYLSCSLSPDSFMFIRLNSMDFPVWRLYFFIVLTPVTKFDGGCGWDKGLLCKGVSAYSYPYQLAWFACLWLLEFIGHSALILIDWWPTFLLLLGWCNENRKIIIQLYSLTVYTVILEIRIKILDIHQFIEYY